jgi:putative transposase
MTNHVHLLLEPEEDGDLGRFMQSVGRRYVRYVNDTYQRSGTLWEGRYKSAVVSQDEYLIACSRYIELNPVRAGMVTHPADYPWSSYPYRALGRPDDLVDDDPWYRSLGPQAADRQRAYQAWMDGTIAEEEWTQIREATQKGRVIGRTEFQEELSERVHRRLVGEARGRPRKPSPTVQENVL